VQREACGLNKIDHVIQVYQVPKEVIARMGPLPMTSIEPKKNKAVAEPWAPLF
jgi:hypothetical protein